MNQLEQAVLTTLVWFDMSRYPLSAFECWWYLYSPERQARYTVGEVEQALDSLRARGKVETENGLWMIAKGLATVSSRQNAARVSYAKLRRARLGLEVIAWLPWVRAVAVVNTVAMHVAKRSSDIDVLVVTAPGRLWFVRLLAVGLLHLLRLRQHGHHTQDRICLSFFVSQDALNFQSLALANDPYLRYWIAFATPVYGSEAIKLFRQNNAWVADHLPNLGSWFSYQGNSVSGFALSLSRWRELFKKGVERATQAALLERIARALQYSRLSRYLAEGMRENATDVVLGPTMLKMHLTDRRAALAKTFQHRCSLVLT